MPTIQVAQITELLAVLASLTVKNLISMCGSPAVPNTSAIMRERVSSGTLYFTPGFIAQLQTRKWTNQALQSFFQAEIKSYSFLLQLAFIFPPPQEAHQTAGILDKTYE